MNRMRATTLVTIFALSLAPAVLAGEASGPQLEPGAKAPPFTLKGTDGKTHSLEALTGKIGTLVVFTCNHCPFARAYEDRLISLAKEFQARGISFVAVSSNDPKVQPEDSFEKMEERAREKALPYPYLYDETQEVARAYGAQVTPHVFLFDAAGVLRYRGRIDDSAKEGEVKSRELPDALAALVGGREVPVPATKAFGCSIKWRKQS